VFVFNRPIGPISFEIIREIDGKGSLGLVNKLYDTEGSTIVYLWSLSLCTESFVLYSKCRERRNGKLLTVYNQPSITAIELVI
jgi:hypothetical protein